MKISIFSFGFFRENGSEVFALRINKPSPNTYLLLALLIGVVLFISSSMTYQQQTSVPFLEKYLTNKPFEQLLSGLSFQYANETVSISQMGYFKFLEFFIRKGAHFSIYLGLGAFLAAGLSPRLNSRLLTVIVSSLSAIGYAALDEFHQMLTGDRTPLFQDVVLDGLGALVGVGCVILFSLRRKKRS
ncbi:VanZ family protein [Liquorilactobacillus sucicola DSM 21376 = JCM 15457]|uniref:VanZ family protein n=1 Tax=Liquorilactobacillus sucicola DSM 21376 = JCM 15457 TaxID=1423806 RepID=A0A0R2E250_9LACO|nr:VanZ family protein [Liquorilactobacillus sucicola DSM 21376 = JCM 15457]